VQAGGEQVLDHDDPLDHGAVEVAPSAGGALGADEPLLLVVPQGPGADAAGLRQLTDTHETSVLAVDTSVKVHDREAQSPR
jgi:hypothetical protein